MKKMFDFLAKIWDDGKTLTWISVALAVIFLLIFLDVIFLYIILVVLAFLICAGLDMHVVSCNWTFSKYFFIALIITIVVTFLMSFVVGDAFGIILNEKCPYCGGKGYFGGGKYGQMVDCPDC